MDIFVTEPAATSLFKLAYERMRPMIVWLGLAQLAWLAYWLLTAADVGSTFGMTVVSWIVVMLVWMVLIIYLGTRNFFSTHTRWFSNLLGVSLTVALAVVWFTATPVAREGVVHAAAGAGDVQLVAIHILRLLAIGTVIKYFQQQRPLHFVVAGSLPDFLFATSAVAVAILAANGPPPHSFLLTWHVIGLSLFLGAGVSMFFSVPSVLRIYHSEPDTSIAF